MTDQVSNALSILSYFSSLLDPISTSQKQNFEKLSSRPHDNITESSKLPPSSSVPSSSTAPVSLNLSSFATHSIPDSFQPVVIGLKLPLSLACTTDLQTSSSSTALLTTATSSIDHQTFFFINPVISPGIVGPKADSMGPSASQSLAEDDGSHQSIFNESSWLPGSCPRSPAKKSMDSIKSESMLASKNNSDLNDSTASSSPWRDGGEETNFQFPCSTLAFSIPFSTNCDSKLSLTNETQQLEVINNSCLPVRLDSLPKSSTIQTSNSDSATNAMSTFHAIGSSIGGATKEEKICAVCGDRALGCNFDAVSCESCKAFFRRNAFKEQKINCLFEGNCQINVNTRRFCSYCRLKQCFSAGMKKDLILGVEEKKRRMEVVKLNRKRRSEESVSSTTTVANSTTTSATDHSTSSDVLSNGTRNLLTLAKLDPLASASSSSSTLRSQSIDSQLVRKLTAEESHMLIDLNQVYDLSFTVDLEPLIHITQLNPSLNQLVNQSSYTVLRLIKFAKRLEDFVKLSQDLQISILKGCWFHLLLLRPVSLFDAERDGWITPKGVIPTDILKNATGYVQLHDDHVRYCRSIKSIIGNDIMLLVILLVLVLFAPDGPHVVAREVISNIQDRYVILLKHYLEAKYTFKRSAHMFPQLLEKIRELNSLVENHAKILMDINPQEIEPIMLEMLDYKN